MTEKKVKLKAREIRRVKCKQLNGFVGYTMDETTREPTEFDLPP